MRFERFSLHLSLPYNNILNSDSIFNTSDSIFNTSNPTSASDTSTDCTALIPPSNNHTLTVLYSNCRSILPKNDHLRLLVTAQNPHIIAICETWLDNNISNDELFIPGYSLIRHDRTRNGGGIALYIIAHYFFFSLL